MAVIPKRFIAATAVIGGVLGALFGYMAAPREGSPEPSSSARAPAGAPSHRGWKRTVSPDSGAKALASGTSPAPAAVVDGPLRTLIVAGGSYPEGTEVSLEQNAALAERVLPGPALTLFAGGTDSKSVRTLQPEPDTSLRRRLGDLFQPRVGRGSEYRKPDLQALPATAEQVERRLRSALEGGGDPLVMYVAAHGEKGQRRRDNFIALWGGDSISVAELAALHDRHSRRRLVVVSTTCFSGGFAELAFAGADPGAGVTRAPRCGLFAGTWDREASGCDPNPDRRAQESYSQHMLNALRRRDRDARTDEKTRFDLDGDGAVSFLEAHTRAVNASISIDVPTTTSERFIRMVQEDRAPVDPEAVVEYGSVIRALGERLGLGTEDEAVERLGKVTTRLEALDHQIVEAERELDRQYAALSTRLLERWPVLDDPYHRAFQRTLRRHDEAIRRVLDESPEAAEFRRAQQQLDRLDTFFIDLQVEQSLTLRLVRAYETLGLVTALKRRGGRDWRHYARLLDCERYVP